MVAGCVNVKCMRMILFFFALNSKCVMLVYKDDAEDITLSKLFVLFI